VDCVYALYSDTYQMVAHALRRRDADRLRATYDSVRSLDGHRARVAEAALDDAVNRIPLRAKAHLCRLRLHERCRGCGESGAVDKPVCIS
jgi:hypothetical protein